MAKKSKSDSSPTIIVIDEPFVFTVSFKDTILSTVACRNGIATVILTDDGQTNNDPGVEDPVLPCVEAASIADGDS